MATTVDELIVRIKADTKSLETSLGRVKKKTNDALNPKSSNRLRRSLGGVRTAALAAAAGIAAIAVIKVARVGAEFESLKLSLQSVYGSAQQGQAAFRQIQKFAQESPFQIKDLSKAFIQLKSAGIEPTKEMMTTFADGASVAVDSLGAFQAMVRITQRSTGGGLGIEDLSQIADRGIPVFEILAEKLGRTRDQITEMGKTAAGSKKLMDALIDGMNQKFGGTVALKMTSLTQKLSTMQDSFDNLADTIFDEGGIGGAMKFLVEQAGSFATSVAETIKMLDSGQSRKFVQATTLEEKLAVKQGERADQVKNAGTFATPFSKRELAKTDAFIASLKEQIKQRDLLNAKSRAEMLATKKRTDAAVAENLAAEATAEARVDSLDNLKSIMDGLKTPTESIKEQMAAINAEIALLGGGGGGEIPMQELQEALKRLGVELEDIKSKTKDAANVLSTELLAAITQNVNALTNDFVSALMNGQSALQSFKDFSKSLVSQIISIFLQLLVVNQIVDALGAGFAGLTGGTYTRGAGGPQYTPPVKQQATPILTAASGGAMQRGSPTLVGERGPEMFIPSTAGRLMNGNDTRSMGGGAGIVINQNINLSTGVAATVRQEVTKMMPTISEMTKASVLAAAGRGGRYRRGLMGA